MVREAIEASAFSWMDPGGKKRGNSRGMIAIMDT